MGISWVYPSATTFTLGRNSKEEVEVKVIAMLYQGSSEKERGALMRKPFEEGWKADVRRIQADVKDLEKDMLLISSYLENAWFQSNPNIVEVEIIKALGAFEKIVNKLENVKKDLRKDIETKYQEEIQEQRNSL